MFTAMHIMHEWMKNVANGVIAQTFLFRYKRLPNSGGDQEVYLSPLYFFFHQAPGTTPSFSFQETPLFSLLSPTTLPPWGL